MSDNEERLGAHEVAVWLRRHPTFLQQFPDLALTLVVPRDEGPTASLASYQLEVLRDKNRELNRRLHELAVNAQENERLAVRAHQLTLALMKQSTAADTMMSSGWSSTVGAAPASIANAAFIMRGDGAASSRESRPTSATSRGATVENPIARA